MYVDRDKKGDIIGLFVAWQGYDQDVIHNENHPDVKAFRAIDEESDDDKKIRKEGRVLAIKSLKDKGELPPDYEDKKSK